MMMRYFLLAGLMIGTSIQAEVNLFSEGSKTNNSHPIRLEVMPLSFIGLYGASIGFGLTEQIMAGVTGAVISYRLTDTKIRDRSFGIFGTYFAQSASMNSSYVKGIWGTERLSTTVDGELVSGVDGESTLELDAVNSAFLAGYQWVWSSRVFINVGLGVRYTKLKNIQSNDKFIRETENKAEYKSFDFRVGIRPDLEFGLGYVI